MSNTRLQKLLTAYLHDELTTAELQELLTYLRQEDPPEEIRQVIDRTLHDRSFEGYADKTRAEAVFRRIMQEASEKKRLQKLLPSRRPWRAAAAAAVLILAFTAAYLWYHARQQPVPEQDIAQRYQNDALPGGNKATLTLADGSIIALDDTDDSTLIQQGGSQVLKQEEGQLAYQLTVPPGEDRPGKTGFHPQAVVYNTLSTPRGGQYRLVLSDGSKVWLNAASSLRFPATFSGERRQVELIEGEAYFEVTPATLPGTDRKMPFKVTVKDMEIDVLGTHFNIMAYEEENSVRTTLLEGSVLIKTEHQSKSNRQAVPAGRNSRQALKPGQQATLSTGQDNFLVKTVDVQEVTAWKNGLFQFNGADIGTIMRQVSRWYDMEVVFEGTIPKGHYRGKMSRNVPASHFLKILELSGIRFEIRDKTIIVYEN